MRSMILVLGLAAAPAWATETGPCDKGEADASTFACECTRESDKSAHWWGGVDLTASPGLRVASTCFNRKVVDASLSGSVVPREIWSLVEEIGHPIAADNVYYWTPRKAPNNSSLISAEEPEHIIPPPPRLMPMIWAPTIWALFDQDPSNPGAEPFVLVDNVPAPITEVAWAHVDEDEHLDLVINFADDSQWLAYGPFVPNIPIPPPL